MPIPRLRFSSHIIAQYLQQRLGMSQQQLYRDMLVWLDMPHAKITESGTGWQVDTSRVKFSVGQCGRVSSLQAQPRRNRIKTVVVNNREVQVSYRRPRRLELPK